MIQILKFVNKKFIYIPLISCALCVPCIYSCEVYASSSHEAPPPHGEEAYVSQDEKSVNKQSHAEFAKKTHLPESSEEVKNNKLVNMNTNTENQDTSSGILWFLAVFIILMILIFVFT